MYADYEAVGMEQLDCVSQPAKKEPTQMDVGRKPAKANDRETICLARGLPASGG
jgi:hypothetical protein